MKTAEEFYEEQRLIRNTIDITENTDPDYSLPFYQTIFWLMEQYATHQQDDKPEVGEVVTIHTTTSDGKHSKTITGPRSLLTPPTTLPDNSEGERVLGKIQFDPNSNKMIVKFKKDLKVLVAETEAHRDEYKDLKHQDGDKECEAIFRGKYEAYSFMVKELKNLIQWHGIEKQS